MFRIRFLVPLLVLIGITAWFIFGYILNEKKTIENGASKRGTQIMSVEVRHSVAEPVKRELSILGQTKPNRLVKMRAETGGLVKELYVKRGAKVKTGDLLIKLDIQDRGSRLKKAESLTIQRKREYDASVELGKKGYQGENDIALARANYENALALLDEIKLEIKNTEIKAPFDGVFNENQVEIGDFVSREDIIGTLIELDPILIIGQISQQNVYDLEEGQKASIRFVDDFEKEGVISFVSSNANTQTRTFTVEITVENADNKIRSGTSVDINFPLDEIESHFISPALLTLNEEGVLGVEIAINSDADTDLKMVKFYPVEIVKTLPDGLWVSGLPKEMDIITRGQGFVSDGDLVKTIIEKHSSYIKNKLPLKNA